MNGDEFLQSTIKLRRIKWKLDDFEKMIVPKDRGDAYRTIIDELPSILEDMCDVMGRGGPGLNVSGLLYELKTLLSYKLRFLPKKKTVNIEDLLSVKTQERIRYYMSKIRVDEGLTCKQVGEETKTGYTSLYKFLVKGRLIGQRQIVKFAHFVVKRGYKLEE